MGTLKTLFLTGAIGAGMITTPDLSIAQNTQPSKVDTQTTAHKRHVIQVLDELPDSVTKVINKVLGEKPTSRPAHWSKHSNVQHDHSPLYQQQARLDQILEDINTLSRKDSSWSHEFIGQVTTVLARDKHPTEALLYTIRLAKISPDDSTGTLEHSVGTERKIWIEDTNGHVQIFFKKFDFPKDKLPGLSLRESEILRGDPANKDRSTDKPKGPFYYNEISLTKLESEIRIIEERVAVEKEAYRRSHIDASSTESAKKKSSK